LEETLKQAPDLTINLLKLVNSVGFGSKRKIASVGAAISLLGRASLNRWVQIMVFAQQSRTNSVADPLVQTAAVRGRMMESLAKTGLKGQGGLADRAFMVGMLSLMDALFGQPLVDILKPLNLDAIVQDAILHRRGLLGSLLKITEAAEVGDQEAAMVELKNFEALSLDDVNRGQVEALSWANSLGQEGDE
jgi:c-di-GMP-related signal transduction protein